MYNIRFRTRKDETSYQCRLMTVHITSIMIANFGLVEKRGGEIGNL